MEPAKTRPAEVGADADFLAFPVHNVVGVFDDADAAEAAIQELRESGFPDSELAAYYGTEAEKRNFDGARGHSLPRLLSTLQHYGPDRTYLERHERSLRDKHPLVLVHVSDKRHRARAADIMHHHTRGHVTYFGTWVIQDV